MINMSAGKYSATIKRLGITNAALARLLGVNGATARRWKAGGVTGTAAILVRLLDQGTVSIRDLEGLQT